MIKLIESTFYREQETRRKLSEFITTNNNLSMDAMCRQFEKEFSKIQKRKNAVFTSSGSAANLILIQSLLNLGLIKKGDSIGVSSLTWATNVMPLIQLGLKPILMDCEIKNLNTSKRILVETNEKFMLKAVFLTNVLGLSSDIDKIQSFCQKNKILLLEDNCESLGSKVGKKLLGNFGFASTFSYFVGHHLSTIEGGMVCTDNKELAEMLKLVRAHGWDRNLSNRAKTKMRRKFGIDKFYGLYTMYDLAYNVRPNELQGFIGTEQIKYLDEIVRKRAANFEKFQEAAKDNDDIIALDTDHMDLVSNFAMPVIFKTKNLCDRYKKRFVKNNVEIRPIIAGDISKQPFFKKYIRNKFDCKNASFIHNNGFYFGNNPEMSKKVVKTLCSLLKKIT